MLLESDADVVVIVDDDRIDEGESNEDKELLAVVSSV